MTDPDERTEPPQPSSAKPLIWVLLLLLLVGGLVVFSISDVWDEIFSIEEAPAP